MARSTTDSRLTFVSLYEDNLSGLTKEYQVRYYLEDGSVDIGDISTRKPILKRTGATPGTLSRSDFVLGSKVVVFGRLLHLVRYADQVTKQLCEGAPPTSSIVHSSSRQQHGEGGVVCDTMYVVVGGRHLSTVGTALSVVEVELGFTISGLTAGTLPSRDVAAIVSELNRGGVDVPYAHVDGSQGSPTQQSAARHIESLSREKAFKNNMVVVIRASKPGAHQFVDTAMKRLGGAGVWVCATQSSTFLKLAASQKSPAVAALATGPAAEAIFASVEQRAARRYRGPSGADASTGGIAIIKPHVVKAKEAGLVLQELLEGVAVSKPGQLPPGVHPPHPSQSSTPTAVLGGLSLVALSVGEASSLLAPYRGVLDGFSQVAAEVAAGPFIVVHLTTQATITAEVEACAYSVEDNLVEAGRRMIGDQFEEETPTSTHHQDDGDMSTDIFDNLRELCGPHDPSIAKLLRSRSLRARYGKSSSQNAIHCTDLPEDVSSIGCHLLGHIAVRRAAAPTDGCA